MKKDESFGPIKVARDKSGKLIVLDGQHRAKAAKKK